MFHDAHRLADDVLSSLLGHALLGDKDEVEGILVLGQQVAAVIGISHQVGTVGILSLLAQAAVEHTAHHAAHVIDEEVAE